MRIEIEIPKEFECDYNVDKFKDFFGRIIAEIIYSDVCCGNYELETAQMLKKAFVESKVAYDVEAKVAELEKTKNECEPMYGGRSCGKEAKAIYAMALSYAIEIVRGKE